jgi:hypothetical protein
VMPWLQLLFDAWEDYKRLREFEAAELAVAERLALEQAEPETDEDGDGSGDEDDEDGHKKKKKHKDKHKK